jgi:hypothetical protein
MSAPNWLGAPPVSATSLNLTTNTATINSVTVNPVPIVEFANEITLGSAGGNFYTSTTVYPGGTYMVGMNVECGGTFTATDFCQFIIGTTGFTDTVAPELMLPLVNVPALPVSRGTMCGIMKFPSAQTITWRVSGSFTNPLTISIKAEGGWIQRIA